MEYMLWFISTGGMKHCSLTSLAPLDHVTHEELIGAYHIALASIQIRYNLIKIPHL